MNISTLNSIGILSAACVLLTIAVTNRAFAEPNILERNIASGEVLELDHSVVIKGNIGTNARVNITHGGIRVEGTIGDGAIIKTRNGSIESHSSYSGTGNSVMMVNTNGHSTTVINGHVITVDSHRIEENEPLGGIEVDGDLGKDVHLDTDGSIAAKNAGEKLHADASGSVTLNHIASSAQIKAGGSITAENADSGSVLNAGGSITCGDVGHASNLKAGGSITAGYVDSSLLSAGGSITAQNANDTGPWRAGGSIIVSGNSAR